MEVYDTMLLTPEQAFKPRIAITMGDPCGVGPEIIVKAHSSPDLVACCLPVVIGEVKALRACCRFAWERT